MKQTGYRKLRLGVNVDHVATLRQSRGTKYPSPVEAALICERAGAHGITVHLREDRRHIQDADVFQLRKVLKARLNLEMANTPGILAIALKVKPDEVCLVPEKRAELTTEGGLDALKNFKALKPTIQKLSNAGIMVSLFVEPDQRQLRAAAELNVPFVELHTGTFCNAKGWKATRDLKLLIEGARYAHELGLKVNAGHGINLQNMRQISNIPHMDTLNIGHSIIARAVFVGLTKAVREMSSIMATYKGYPI